jgi:hypothetical protein
MIAFESGASNTAASASTVGVAYTPNPGDMLIAFVAIGGGIVTGGMRLTDSTGQDFATGPQGPTGPLQVDAGYLYSFWQLAPGGATSYTASWNGAFDASIVFGAYSGAGSLSWAWAGNSAYNTGTGTSANITETTTNPNAFLVMGAMNNSAFPFSGAREAASGVTTAVALADSGNVAVASSTTVSATQALCDFGCLALQLSLFAGGAGATAAPISFGILGFGGLAAMKSPYLGSGKWQSDSGVVYGNYYPPYGQIFPRL